MRIAHLLRKCNPAEWGGTETAVQRLLDGLAAHEVESVVFRPALPEPPSSDPFREAGHEVRDFRAFVPAIGLSRSQKRQLASVGGNLMSFDLFWALRREPTLSVIHTHTLNRLGGIAATVARVRELPLVVTIHGGVLDLPPAVKEKLAEPLQGGWEWGKVFGWLLRSRRVLADADAVVTCNLREAELVRERFPDKIVFMQPHGVPARIYEEDHRAEALAALPELVGKPLFLAVGRIDPVKNQGWLVQQWPRVLQQYPNAHLVVAGACTDEAYGKLLKKEIRNLGLEGSVTLTGGLPQNDPRLIGLFQQAIALLLPSQSETFGLVILEAWAAKTPVLATRTSGSQGLIREGENGWFFALDKPEEFHRRLGEVLDDPEGAVRLGEAGAKRVREDFDSVVLAKRMQHLYDELIVGF